LDKPLSTPMLGAADRRLHLRTVAVHHCCVLEKYQIKPPATPLSLGCYTNLTASGLQEISNSLKKNNAHRGNNTSIQAHNITLYNNKPSNTTIHYVILYYYIRCSATCFHLHWSNYQLCT